MKVAFLALTLTVFLAGCAGTITTGGLAPTEQGALALNETEAPPPAVPADQKAFSAAIPQMAFLSLMVAF
jgi:hypothetical protein